MIVGRTFAWLGPLPVNRDEPSPASACILISHIAAFASIARKLPEKGTVPFSSRIYDSDAGSHQRPHLRAFDQDGQLHAGDDGLPDAVFSGGSVLGRTAGKRGGCGCGG